MADDIILQEDRVSGSALHVRNANSRMIFNNHTLMSQFLRNYTEIPAFGNVQPEDIENVPVKYEAFLGVEFEADTIKRVRINTKDFEENKKDFNSFTKDEELKEVYVLPLIEHKSDVDYDVSMQLLRYVAVIWYDYANRNKNKHGNKGFRYPMIIPVVYYEGSSDWTADLHFESRIEMIAGLERFVPKFDYIVVACHGYTEEELMQKHDEMSLVMLINRVQTPEEFARFLKTPVVYVEEIYGKAPKDIQRIILKVLESLLTKMGVPKDETQTAIANMEEGRMGYLFENMEKMDIQEERRKTMLASERADKAEMRADEAEMRADEAEIRADKAEKECASESKRADRAEQMILSMAQAVITQAKEMHHTKEETIQLLKNQYHMAELAEELMEKLW